MSDENVVVGLLKQGKVALTERKPPNALITVASISFREPNFGRCGSFSDKSPCACEIQNYFFLVFFLLEEVPAKCGYVQSGPAG